MPRRQLEFTRGQQCQQLLASKVSSHAPGAAPSALPDASQTAGLALAVLRRFLSHSDLELTESHGVSLAAAAA